MDAGFSTEIVGDDVADAAKRISRTLLDRKSEPISEVLLDGGCAPSKGICNAKDSCARGRRRSRTADETVFDTFSTCATRDDANLFGTFGSAGWFNTFDKTPDEDEDGSDSETSHEDELESESWDDESCPEIVQHADLSKLDAPEAKASFEAGERANVNFVIRFGFSPPGWQRPGAQQEADGFQSGEDDCSCSSSSVSSGDGSDLGMLDDLEEMAEDGEKRAKAQNDGKAKEGEDTAKEEGDGAQACEAGAHANVNFVTRFGFSPPGWQRQGAQEEADRYQAGEDEFSCSSSAVSSGDGSDLGMLHDLEDTQEDEQRAKAQSVEKAKEEEQHTAKAHDAEGRTSGAGAHANVNFVTRFGFSPPGWQRPGAQQEADEYQSGDDDCSCSSSFVSSGDGSDLGKPEDLEEMEEDDEKRSKAQNVEKEMEGKSTAEEATPEANVHVNVNFVTRFGFSPPGWQRQGSQEEADRYQSGEDDCSCSSSSVSSWDGSDLELFEEDQAEEDDKRRAKVQDDERVNEEKDMLT